VKRRGSSEKRVALKQLRPVFKSYLLRNGPSPWDVGPLKGSVGVKASNASWIQDPQVPAVRGEAMRTDRARAGSERPEGLGPQGADRGAAAQGSRDAPRVPAPLSARLLPPCPEESGGPIFPECPSSRWLVCPFKAGAWPVVTHLPTCLPSYLPACLPD
jgi:hypothetical protein